MTDHDDIRAALVRDHQRGGKFPADPELQHRAADWLAELLAEVNDAQAEAHNAQADYDRRGERLWRLAALAGWTPGNESDNDATAELYIKNRLAEVRLLARWKNEALPVIAGLEELGGALGIPLGKQITGPDALGAVKALTARAEAAEQTIQRMRSQCDAWSHGNSWNKAARNAILRALDGGDSGE